MVTDTRTSEKRYSFYKQNVNFALYGTFILCRHKRKGPTVKRSIVTFCSVYEGRIKHDTEFSYSKFLNLETVLWFNPLWKNSPTFAKCVGEIERGRTYSDEV